MASAAAAASGLRQQLCRTSSNPLLSSSLRHHRQCRRFFSLMATLSFHSLSSHFPPPSLSRPPYLSADGGFPRLLSSPASATRVSCSRRSVSVEEGDVEEEEDEERDVFDVASYDDDDELAEEEEEEEEEEEDAGEDGAAEGPEFRGKMEFESPAAQVQQQLPRYPSPMLSVKEKKELGAYAHSLGKKLKSQQVGKSGITPSVVAAFIETLEANELLKLKVHGSCPGDLPEVIDQLEALTGSVAVGRIGRSVILYRPSLSKMQKKEVRTFKKTWRPSPKEEAGGLKLQKRRPLQRLSGRRSSSSSNSSSSSSSSSMGQEM